MDDDQPSKLVPPTGDAASTSSSQLCVLLVEDDRSVRRYLEVTLQRSGYRVIAAGDGLEAMKIALSSQIDALVTDAIMPHLSGQQLAAFFRGNPKLAGIPIVLLTGQENKQNASSPHNLIDTFLYKPVNNQELIRCLAKLLKGSDPNSPHA